MLIHRLLAVALAATACAAPALAAGTTATPQPHRVYTVKDSPGYYSVPDPESASVVIGRRTNAPIVRKPFTGGTASLDDLGRAVCWGLQHTAVDTLGKLCITDAEFRDILWREFPQSRPATGVQWDDAWRILWARLHAGRSHAMRDYGGHYYQFVKWQVDSVAHYKNFTLHSKLTLVAKDDAGQVQRWTWLRAVAERKGRFKIYSTDD